MESSISGCVRRADASTIIVEAVGLAFYFFCEAEMQFCVGVVIERMSDNER
jgi:hypothetical protein